MCHVKWNGLFMIFVIFSIVFLCFNAGMKPTDNIRYIFNERNIYILDILQYLHVTFIFTGVFYYSKLSIGEIPFFFFYAKNQQKKVIYTL